MVHVDRCFIRRQVPKPWLLAFDIDVICEQTHDEKALVSSYLL